MSIFSTTIEIIGLCIDVAGSAVILFGALFAFIGAIMRFRRSDAVSYSTFRQQLGKSILLGLELLVAADIIRTVAVSPTLVSVAVLGAIVLIRTFLSFTLELELTGSWPWQKKVAHNAEGVNE